MRLSELKTGEKGVIVKVLGHGGFRKRIVEMGFIKGKTVEVILNAPLKDPIKYKILGYEISLRRQEAEMIEIVDETQVGELARMHSAEALSTRQLNRSCKNWHADNDAPSTWPLWATQIAERLHSSTLPAVHTSTWETIAV